MRECVEDRTYKMFEKSKRLNCVIDYIEKNYQNQITLDEISKEAGFSKYHFTRFFKDMTGVTFLNYLNNFRISKVENALANTEISITHIAMKSGFKNIKTFNRVFKNINGCSPMEYRKRLIS